MHVAFFEGTVCAAVVTYSFSGALDDSFGTLAAGTTYSGSFSYDDSQPLSISSANPLRADYSYDQFSISISGQLFTSSSGTIHLYDYDLTTSTGYTKDLIEISTLSLSGTLGGLNLASDAGIQLVLEDLTGNALTGLGLPKGDLSLGDFTGSGGAFLHFKQASVSGSLIDPQFSCGSLSSLSAVPEPSTPLMVFSAVWVLSSMRYRCRRSLEDEKVG